MTPTLEMLPKLFLELTQKVDSLICSQNQSQQSAHTNEPERPIGIREAAAFAGLAVQTIYQTPDFPKHKTAKKLLFFKSEILEWVKARRVKSSFEINAAVDNAISSHL